MKITTAGAIRAVLLSLFYFCLMFYGDFFFGWIFKYPRVFKWVWFVVSSSFAVFVFLANETEGPDSPTTIHYSHEGGIEARLEALECRVLREEDQKSASRKKISDAFIIGASTIVASIIGLIGHILK